MNKQEALALYKSITSGYGAERQDILAENGGPLHRGDIAKHVWNGALFTYGIEYGVMIGLIRAFDLTAEDIDGFNPEPNDMRGEGDYR